MNLIIVEDDLVIQLFLEEALSEDIDQSNAENVYTFSTVEETIEFLNQDKFKTNFLFIDYSLEGDLTGVDLAKHIDSNCPNCYYYFLSGNASIIKQSTYGNGCLGILSKPISENELHQKVLQIKQILAK